LPLIESLDHVIVVVRDLAAAARSHRSLLGRSHSWRGSHPAYGTENVLFRVANTYLELLSPVGPGALADALRSRLDDEGEGLAGLAFATSDAAALTTALRARGIEASEPQPGLGRDDENGAFRRWYNVLIPREATRGVGLFAIQHQTPPEALPPARPMAAEDACVAALDHVVIESGDLEASKSLYGDALGLRLALDRRFDALGLRMLFFRTGGVTVEVVGRLDPEAAPQDRLGGLAWRVPDLRAAHERLCADLRPGRTPGTTVCTLRGGCCGVPTLLIGPGTATDPAAIVR
jgi:catechol 2,3-dioxygenase-like lactoylglutathione lyase family enzyme